MERRGSSFHLRSAGIEILAAATQQQAEHALAGWSRNCAANAQPSGKIGREMVGRELASHFRLRLHGCTTAGGAPQERTTLRATLRATEPSSIPRAQAMQLFTLDRERVHQGVLPLPACDHAGVR